MQRILTSRHKKMRAKAGTFDPNQENEVLFGEISNYMMSDSFLANHPKNDGHGYLETDRNEDDIDNYSPLNSQVTPDKPEKPHHVTKEES